MPTINDIFADIYDGVKDTAGSVTNIALETLSQRLEQYGSESVLKDQVTLLKTQISEQDASTPIGTQQQINQTFFGKETMIMGALVLAGIGLLFLKK